MKKADKEKEELVLSESQKEALQVLFNISDKAVERSMFNNTAQVFKVHSCKLILEPLLK